MRLCCCNAVVMLKEMAHMWEKFKRGVHTAAKVAGGVAAVGAAALAARNVQMHRQAETDRQALASFREYRAQQR